MEVAHYFIRAQDVEAEIQRLRDGRNQVAQELQRLQQTIAQMGPKEAPHELSALLDVHLMLLQDVELEGGIKRWIVERLYNAEWALTAQLDVISLRRYGGCAFGLGGA
jgi:phosphotransferase system enzyme I (PtsI)